VKKGHDDFAARQSQFLRAIKRSAAATLPLSSFSIEGVCRLSTSCSIFEEPNFAMLYCIFANPRSSIPLRIMAAITVRAENAEK
jgi:hypothetical protein